MTASQPFSRVLILSFNSLFSFSRASSRWRSSSEVCEVEIPMPARSWRFSSSRSATRRSRSENCAFRRSREFCAAMRLRCARASLRSSGVTSERERLRGGNSSAGDGEGQLEEAVEGPGRCSTTKAASAVRFMVVVDVRDGVEIRGGEKKEEASWSCRVFTRTAGVRGGGRMRSKTLRPRIIHVGTGTCRGHPHLATPAVHEETAMCLPANQGTEVHPGPIASDRTTRVINARRLGRCLSTM